MTATPRPSRDRRGAGALLLLACGALIWTGCNIERDYETLSFFFDGVPVPESRLPESERRDGPRFFAGGGGQPVSIHTAYKERRCFECHGEKVKYGFTTEGFEDLDGSTCIECHVEAVQHDFLHGPVAGSQCTACHEPHVAVHPKLLIQEASALCLECHGRELRTAELSEYHVDLERGCLDCHDPHGGADRSFTLPREAWREPSEAEGEGG